MSDTRSTEFESHFLVHQPISLKNQTAKYVAEHIVMMSDCLTPEFYNLAPQVQHRIALFLNGKWSTQFVCEHNSSLSTIEACMDAADPSKETSFIFLESFFSDLKNNHENYNFYNLMADCYISEKCNMITSLPVKLYFLGIRDNLDVFSRDFLFYSGQYFSSCSNNFTPTFFPLGAPLPFLTFENNIYSSTSNVDEKRVLKKWAHADEIPRRMTWAQHFLTQDRYPESLVQVLASLNVLTADNTTFEILDIMSLLILIAATLHFNIKCQSFIVSCALSLVTFDNHLVILIPSILKMFSELGEFPTAKLIFESFLPKNKQSQFHIQTLENYANCLIEQCENNFIKIVGIAEFHQDCSSLHSRCYRVKAQGITKVKIKNLLFELHDVISLMHPSPETDLFKAQYFFLRAFLYKEENYKKNYQSCLNTTGALLSLVLENATKPITKIIAHTLNLVYMSRIPMAFTDSISDRICHLNKASISNLRGKLIVKTICFLLMYYKPESHTVAERTTLNGYIEDAITTFSLISNKKHYRLRLLKALEKVFYRHLFHSNGDVVSFNILKTHISLKKSKRLKQCFFPNFPDLANASHIELISNQPRILPPKKESFNCNSNFILALDPYIKNHIAFGAAQLKFRDG